MRETIICQSDYARDGRGVHVRHARRLDGSPGPVFCRFEEELLVNGPTPGKAYPDRVVGWMAQEDVEQLAREWGTGEVAELDPPAESPSATPPPEPIPASGELGEESADVLEEE